MEEDGSGLHSGEDAFVAVKAKSVHRLLIVEWLSETGQLTFLTDTELAGHASRDVVHPDAIVVAFDRSERSPAVHS